MLWRQTRQKRAAMDVEDPGITAVGSPLEPFLEGADPGLRAAVPAFLRPIEVLLTAWASRRIFAVLAGRAPATASQCGTGGLCCPHLRPRNGQALNAAVMHCDAPQLRTLRPGEGLSELGQDAGSTQALASRLGSFVWLEELGPLHLDADGTMLPSDASLLQNEESANDDNRESSGSNRRTVEAAKRIPVVLGEGFARCRSLAVLRLTVHCIDVPSSKAVAQSLLPGIGECQNLRELDLDVDSSLGCGGVLVAGVASLLDRLRLWSKLQFLGLGYLWWTEASDEAVAALLSALQGFQGSMRSLELRYPQDPEFGGLESASAAIEGAAQSLEHVRILEGWASNGDGLAEVAKACGLCAKLRLVELRGQLPRSFDPMEFASQARTSATSMPGGAASMNSRPSATLELYGSQAGTAHRAGRATTRTARLW